MAYFASVADMVGGTPLLELARFGAERGLGGRLFAKLEKNNPAGSAKDRVAKYMIAAAERDGKLAAGDTVVEPTSIPSSFSMVDSLTGLQSAPCEPQNEPHIPHPPSVFSQTFFSGEKICGFELILLYHTRQNLTSPVTMKNPRKITDAGARPPLYFCSGAGRTSFWWRRPRAGGAPAS